MKDSTHVSVGNLDCNTPLGQEYVQSQNVCLNRLSNKWGVQIFTTDETAAADIDGIATRNGRVKAIMEVKSREIDLSTLTRWGSYLITYEKIEKLERMAKALVVPGFLVVSLLHDGNIVYWKVCDEYGNRCVDLLVKNTLTQATCNGGETVRANAYISLEDMKRL